MDHTCDVPAEGQDVQEKGPETTMKPVTSKPIVLPSPRLVLRREDLAEEWHFDEVALFEKVRALREEGDAYLAQERARRALIEQTKHDCEVACEEVLKRASERDRTDSEEVSRLRTEILAHQDDQERIEAETEEEVQDLDRKCLAETARREALRKALLAARGQVPGYQAREEKIQEEEVQAFQASDRELAERRKGIQAEVDEINRLTHEKVQRIEERLAQDLQRVHDEISSAWNKEYSCVADTLGERRVLYQEAGSNQDSVDREVRTKLDETHTEMMNRRACLLGQVRATAQADFASEAGLRSALDDAYVGERCAAEEAHHAAHYELKNHERTGQMVAALGSKFHRSTQYSMNLDSRTRSTLKTSARSILNSPSSASPDGC